MVYISTPITEIPSMDSWDLENLKYVRQMSAVPKAHTSSGEEYYCTDESINASDTISWFTSSTDPNAVNYSKEVLTENTNSFVTCYGESFGANAELEYVDATEPEDTFFSLIDMPPPSRSPSPMLDPLENCCLVDVVMVKNESVYAETSKVDKLQSSTESDGTSSSNMHTAEEGEIDPEIAESLTTNFKKNFQKFKDSIEAERKNSETGRNTLSNSYDSGKFTDYFYFGQRSDLEYISSSRMISGDFEYPSAPSEISERTPSPYYVKLRRDLFPSKPFIKPHPRNFGLDTNGQLLIDYSTNWDNLEKYVGNLVGC